MKVPGTTLTVASQKPFKHPLRAVLLVDGVRIQKPTRKLEPYIIALPSSSRTLNVNTASQIMFFLLSRPQLTLSDGQPDHAVVAKEEKTAVL